MWLHQHGSNELWDLCPRDETLCNPNSVTAEPESLSKQTERNHFPWPSVTVFDSQVMQYNIWRVCACKKISKTNVTSYLCVLQFWQWISRSSMATLTWRSNLLKTLTRASRSAWSLRYNHTYRQTLKRLRGFWDAYESLLWPLRQRLRMDCCCTVERMNMVEEISPPWPSYGENYTTGISNYIWVLIMALANTFDVTFQLCRFQSSFVL